MQFFYSYVSSSLKSFFLYFKCEKFLHFHFQEEKFVLRHMERQEPQGEENGDPLNSKFSLF